MTAAELRARLTHALMLQNECGFSTPAALAAAWGLSHPEPAAIIKTRVRRSAHRRRSRVVRRGSVPQQDVAQRARQTSTRVVRERQHGIKISDG